MLSLNSFSMRSRRWALRASAFGFTAAVAHQAFAGVRNRPPISAASAKNCIVIWLDGGPSHLETFDPKPDAPGEVRGPFASIATAVPGVSFTECLPLLSGRMNDLAVIRSMTSPLGEHNFGTHYLMTGHRPSPVLTHPTISAVAVSRRDRAGALPNYVAIPQHRVGGVAGSAAGFLGSAAAPFELFSDPADKDFAVRDLEPFDGITVERIGRRREFLRAVDALERTHGRSAEVGAVDGETASPAREQAWRLLASAEARSAFRLEEETDQVRNRYGRRSVGQSCLLARRLVERGVPFVTVNHKGWDTHTDLVTRLKDGYTGAKVPVGLIPTLDQSVAALLDDLKSSGLLDETMVIVMGEFGRTPKLNTNAGRDHWPRVFSVLLAGGGVQGGQIIGSSDRTGEGPLDNPVTPSDLARTVFTALGIDPDSKLPTGDGREVAVATPESRMIPGLLS